MTKTFTPEDQFYMAATIWAEARGQGAIGMRNVAHIIANRVAAGKFGRSVASVVLKPAQFSCWNKSDPNFSKLSTPALNALDPATPDGQAWKLAQNIARLVLQGIDADPTNGGLYYHTKDHNMVWDNALIVVAEIGNTLFYGNPTNPTVA